MKKFYIVEHSYSDGYNDSPLKSKYFLTLESAKKYLECVIKGEKIINRWDRPEEGILDAITLEGDYGDETEYYTLVEETFEEDK